MRVLFAPDAFKGTFDAPAVAAALARGLERTGAEADVCPVADGGEGTMALLASAFGARLETVTASDPLGRPVECRFAVGVDPSAVRSGLQTPPPPGLAIVEMAQASGLGRVAEHERDARAASTRGTGELILAAVAAGAREILVGVGGSATTDGGRGAIEAIREGGGLRGARLKVLCDVLTAFEDAPRIFGPQKGADGATVAWLEERLQRFAGELPRDPRGVEATGAAGGLSGGLWAAFDAELLPGAATVLDALGVDERMRAAGLVVAGEGCLDAQSLGGKVVGELARRAGAAGVALHAVVGSSRLSAEAARAAGIERVWIASTLAEIEAAGAAIAGATSPSCGAGGSGRSPGEAAGEARRGARAAADGPVPRSENVTWQGGGVAGPERPGPRGATVWLTGLPASGKSTIAGALERRLVEAGRLAYRLDGDNLRHGLNGDLGFSAADRAENVRRTAHVARMFADAGLVAIVALISPARDGRAAARALHAARGLPFLEVFVDTPLDVCERRDPKGLYAKARAGEIAGLTGVDDPYEPPADPELRIETTTTQPAEAVALLVAALDVAAAPATARGATAS